MALSSSPIFMAVMAFLAAAASAQMLMDLQGPSLVAASSRQALDEAKSQQFSFKSRKLAQADINITNLCINTCRNAGAGSVAVCTTNGTFPDLCGPSCASPAINITYLGNCTTPPCLCPISTFFPVCGGGTTFNSPCFANCSSVTYRDGYCSGDCNCPSTNSTICGRDGKNYQNTCFATCAGVETWYSGPCDARIGNCSCTPTYDPVCVSTVLAIRGADGLNVTTNQTYTSPCIAQCDGARNWTAGVCPDDLQANAKAYLCNCTSALDPVIVRAPGLPGSPSNKTFTVSNQCIATCLNQTVLSKGISTDCICPFQNSPVCANNVTYTTGCAARCEGNATTWTPGACAGPGGAVTDCSLCPIPTSAADLVCGSDGITYPNACFATCRGVRVASNGICGAPPGGFGGPDDEDI